MPRKKLTASDLTLKYGDYYQLNKLLKKHTENIVDTVNNFVDHCTESMFAAHWITIDLLCALIEQAGNNPLEESKLLLAHKIYLHSSMESDVPGISVLDGKVYRDGKPVEDARYKYLYYAKGKDIHFGEAFNKTFGLGNKYDKNENENETA